MKRRGIVALLLLPPCLLALYGPPAFGAGWWIAPGFLVAATYATWVNFSYFAYPCPRCRRPFASNMGATGVLTEYPHRLPPGASHSPFLTPWSSHCRHCGLARGAAPTEEPSSDSSTRARGPRANPSLSEP